jgi:hypothetical protein
VAEQREARLARLAGQPRVPLVEQLEVLLERRPVPLVRRPVEQQPGVLLERRVQTSTPSRSRLLR